MSFHLHSTPALADAVANVAPGDLLDPPCSGLSEELQEKVLTLAASSIFGKMFDTASQLEDYLDTGNDVRDAAMRTRLNEVMLPFDGFGRNCFMFNEIFPDGTDIRSFATLGDLDRADFVEKAKLAEEDGIQPRVYRGNLLLERARWIEHGGLVYGFLSTALMRIAEDMYYLADELAEARWPTVLEAGPEHGAPSYDFCGLRTFKHDIRRMPALNAEKSDLAYRAYFPLITELVDTQWAEAVARSGAWVWRERRHEEGDEDQYLIFSGPSALDSMRFSHWIDDLARLDDGAAVYAALHASASSDVSNLVGKVLDVVDWGYAVAEEWDDGLSASERKERLGALIDSQLERHARGSSSDPAS